MPKLLFATWSFPGHIHPALAVAQAVRAGGNDVAFFSGRRAAEAVSREGFEVFPFEGLNEDRVYDHVFAARPASWTHPHRFFAVLKEWLLSTIPDQVADLEHIQARWRPDAIVSDVTLWAPGLVLHERTGIPVAVLSYALGCMIPGPDAPPWGMGLASPSTAPKRLLGRVVGLTSDLLTRDFRRFANDLRRRYELPALACAVHEHLGTMPLYLVPSAAALDYERRDLPSSVRYVGPLVWSKPRREAVAPWIEAWTRDRPLVHVCEGTMHAQPPFLLRAAVDGLSQLPVQLVLTTGSYRDPAELAFGPLAANVRVERFIPHSDLFPITDVVVTTGGAGTVLTALQLGIPLVVVPTEWDKFDNAQRVVEAGAGVRIPPRRCTPSGLREAVTEVLRDGAYRTNAGRIAAAFRELGGATQAAKLLDAMIAGEGTISRG